DAQAGQGGEGGIVLEIDAEIDTVGQADLDVVARNGLHAHAAVQVADFEAGGRPRAQIEARAERLELDLERQGQQARGAQRYRARCRVQAGERSGVEQRDAVRDLVAHTAEIDGG